MKKIPGKLAPLSLILLAIYNPYVLAQGDSDHHHTHKPEDSDDSAVQLESMTISTDAMEKPFQSQQLLKNNLGSAGDGADILKQTPGISLIRQGGTASDPLLRGLGGTRLNILIDSVPFAGACNHRMDPATAYVSPGTFDALTLLKGPQGVRYGNSIAGAINFESEPLRFDEPGVRAYSSYLYGSFNQQNISANVSAGFKQGYIAYSANRSRGSNYSDGDGVEIAQTFHDTENDRVTLGLTPTEDTTIELSALQSDAEIGNATIHMDVTKLRREQLSFHLTQDNITPIFSRFDLRYDYTQVEHLMDSFSLRPIHGSSYALMGQDVKRHFAKAEATFDLTPDTKLWGGIEYIHDRYDARAEGGDSDSRCRTLRPGTQATPGDLECTTGRGQSGFRAPPPSGFTKPNERILDFDKFRGYTEISYQYAPNLSWVAGVSGTSVGTDTGFMTAAGQISDLMLSGSNKHRRQTLMAGFVRAEYAFNDLPIVSSIGYGHAEREADYWEIYSMDAFDLDAEEHNEMNAMMKYTGDKFTGEAHVFYSQTDNFILVEGGASADNIKAERYGGEIAASYALTDHLSVVGDLSYIYGVNKTGRDIIRNRVVVGHTGELPLAQTPPLEGSIDFRYQRDNAFYQGDSFSASLKTRLVASQNRIDKLHGNVLALDSTPTAGFATLSLELGYKPHPLVDLKFGVDNLLDKTYTEHISRNTSPVIDGVSSVKINEPGRAFWGRITINFDYPEL